MYDDTLIKWITIEINELPIVESLADNEYYILVYNFFLNISFDILNKFCNWFVLFTRSSCEYNLFTKW